MLGLPHLRGVEQASSPYRRPKLKITEVRTAEVRVHDTSARARVHRPGHRGPGRNHRCRRGQRAADPLLWRMLTARPLNVEAAFERIRTSGIFAGAQGGQYITALTGVETALWTSPASPGRAGLSVTGRQGPRPGARLLRFRGARDDSRRQRSRSGSRRSRIWASPPPRSISTTRAIRRASTASTGPPTTPRSTTCGEGSLHPGVVSQEHRPGGGHARRYDAGTAKRVAKELEPFKLIAGGARSAREHRRHARRARLTSTPICCGENIFLRHGSARFSRSARWTSSCRFPKMRRPAGSRKIADMAHAYYIPVAPHAVTSPIA